MDGKWEIIDEREIDRAESLMWDGRYDEARQLLVKLNNEPARQLLAQLPQPTPPQIKSKDRVQPPKHIAPEKQHSALALVLVIIMMATLCMGLYGMTRNASGRYSATPRPYATTNPGLILYSCFENAQLYDEDCFARNFAYDQCRAQGHDASYCRRQVRSMYP